jgi:hypothetical protein
VILATGFASYRIASQSLAKLINKDGGKPGCRAWTASGGLTVFELVPIRSPSSLMFISAEDNFVEVNRDIDALSVKKGGFSD